MRIKKAKLVYYFLLFVLLGRIILTCIIHYKIKRELLTKEITDRYFIHQ